MGQYEQPAVVVVDNFAAAPPAYTPVVQSTTFYTSPGTPNPQGPPQIQVLQAPAPIMPIPEFTSEPTYAPCPMCRQTVGTKTEKEVGGCNYLAAAIMCVTCLWCCACIPLCVDSCKDTKHRCSRCNCYLGVHQRL
jgi:lipopolysaccharide-induced tumor necrosis factor-alpha factor